MDLFFASAPAWVLASYWAAAGLLMGYLVWKLVKRKYLFSPYTVVVLTFAFALLVVAPMQYNDQAWHALGSMSAVPMFPYLHLSVGVNSFGFLLTVGAMWWFESRTKALPTPPFFPRPPQIAISTVAIALFTGLVLFAVCLAMVGTIPLFGMRTIFNVETSLRPLYNFANYLILFTTSVIVVWSFIARSSRYVLLILGGLVCMLFTGGRMSFLSVVQLILFMWIYGRFRNRTLRATGVLLAGLAVVAVAGLFLASFRTGSEFDLSSVTDTIFYGNTFSDVRDGAFVVSGWERAMSGTPLGGKTYVAGLMSFIPSSLSTFRESWSWGYFTTSALFGWENHYGFRGGWSLELFMNWGIVGVVAGALAVGWLLGRLESLWYLGVVRDNTEWFPNSYLWSWVGYGVYTVLIASSATYNIYSLLGVLLMLGIMTVLRRSLHTSLGVSRRMRRSLSHNSQT